MADDYINRKFHPEQIVYDVPELEPILKETRGLIIYQEQVMKIAVELGGFSLGGADLLRKAMGKKKADIMNAQKENFLAGAKRKGSHFAVQGRENFRPDRQVRRVRVQQVPQRRLRRPGLSNRLSQGPLTRIISWPPC